MPKKDNMARIDYQLLLDNALKSVVKDALIHAQINGLGDGSHFFITFKTRDAGVVLPDFLRMRYPDVMTIVLQYSYNNLHVSDKEFGVQLTFDGRPFFIRVPFFSLVEFKDPSVDFILTFHPSKAPDSTFRSTCRRISRNCAGRMPSSHPTITLTAWSTS